MKFDVEKYEKSKIEKHGKFFCSYNAFKELINIESDKAYIKLFKTAYNAFRQSGEKLDTHFEEILVNGKIENYIDDYVCALIVMQLKKDPKLPEGAYEYFKNYVSNMGLENNEHNIKLMKIIEKRGGLRFYNLIIFLRIIAFPTLYAVLNSVFVIEAIKGLNENRTGYFYGMMAFVLCFDVVLTVLLISAYNQSHMANLALLDKTKNFSIEKKEKSNVTVTFRTVSFIFGNIERTITLKEHDFDKILALGYAPLKAKSYSFAIDKKVLNKDYQAFLDKRHR